MLAYDEVLVFVSKWDIGSSGAHTKATNCNGSGFASVAQTATGKYTITFARGMPVGPLLDLQLTHWAAADAANLNLRPSVGTFTAETAAAAATVKYEAWDNDTTAQTELASGDQVTIVAIFQKTK
jgi:hypothetical protein